jgi:hypothetical protein
MGLAAIVVLLEAFASGVSNNSGPSHTPHLRVLRAPGTAHERMSGMTLAADNGRLVADTRTPQACAARKTVPYQLRPWDCRLAVIVANGMAKSATFRRLVDRVGELQGILYLKDGYYVNEQTGRRRVFSGGLSHRISMAGAYRVLHLMVAPESGDRPIITMAHELQHAVEVLEATDVTTETGVDQLFDRIGIHAGAGITETQAALDVGIAVARELSTHRESRSSKE